MLRGERGGRKRNRILKSIYSISSFQSLRLDCEWQGRPSAFPWLMLSHAGGQTSYTIKCPLSEHIHCHAGLNMTMENALI